MLPDVDGEERLHAGMGDGRIAVVEGGDGKLALVEDEPGPAAGEVADRLVLELGEHRVGRAEIGIDHLGEPAGGALALRWGEALPEEIMVPDLATIVEQPLVAALGGGADHLA